MKQTRVAARYAKSLVDLALSKGALDDVYADMQLVNQTVSENRDLRLMLDSPVIKGDKKGSVLKAIFATNMKNEISMSFMDILVAKGRESLIDDVAEQVEVQYHAINGKAKAEVVSATSLATAERDEVLKVIQGLTGEGIKDIELKEIINPEIIGGFIVRVGDQQIDQSVSGKLEELRKEFNKNHYIAEH